MASPGSSSEDEADIRDEQRQGEIVQGRAPPSDSRYVGMLVREGERERERERAADW